MNRPIPPIWADRFLVWFCHPDLLEDLQGDLYEIFESRVQAGSHLRARWLFVWLVFRSLRLDVVRPFFSHRNSLLSMTSNNFKIAFRVLSRDRFNTTLSLGGLAIGVTCFLLMGYYVLQEVRFDQFHTKKDQIYRVWLREDYGEGKVFFNAVTPWRFESLMEDNFPEVETAVQLSNENFFVGEGREVTDESIAIISPEMFSVFDFEVVQGNPAKPLGDMNEVILSQSYALKYFGQQDALGRSLGIQVNGETIQFTVSAVFKDIGAQSSLQFNMAISNENNVRLISDRAQEAWFNVGPETYVLLRPEAEIETVEAKIQEVVMGYLAERVNPGEYQVGFQQLTDIHLNPDVPAGIAPVGNRDYVYILAIISVLVLIIACINYTSLTVGKSIKRSKEVGVRKVMGAFKPTLIQQYLTESLVIAFFAIGLGVGLAYLLLPWFNQLAQVQVSLSFEPWHLLLYLSLVLVVGVASGIYPAFVLARQKITQILKGTHAGKQKHQIRKGLVVFQFAITVFLISSTLIMQQQLQYLQSKDLGYDYQATVSVPLYADPASNGLGEVFLSAFQKGELLKEQLTSYPEVSKIGMGSHVFGTPGWAQLSFTDDEEVFRNFRLLVVDPYYFETFSIEVKDGRAFDPERESDARSAVIINQAAADYFGFANPLGSSLPGAEFEEHSIIGVTENFHFASLHTDIEPLIIVQNPVVAFSGISDVGFDDNPTPKLVFRYSGSQLADVKRILDEEWATIFPEEDLNFSFVEENMAALYDSEARLKRLVMVATILSVIIASLGLLGLTVLVVNSRLKEISIRKVIGATEQSLFVMLARSLSLQLFLGIIISVPITLWLMQSWLAGFAFQVKLGPGMFLLSALISILVALLVVSYHTLRAAKANPITTLRSE